MPEARRPRRAALPVAGPVLAASAPPKLHAVATTEDGLDRIGLALAPRVKLPAPRGLQARAPRGPSGDVGPGAGLLDGGSPGADGRGWPAPARVTTTVWFDHTDLAHYFAGNRTPTGIQRVEIELYRAARRRIQTSDGPRADACAFDPERRCWVVLPRDAFDLLCGVPSDPQAAVDDEPSEAPLDDAAWTEAVAAMQAAILAAPPVAFRRHDMLVTVGASWWITDYLVFVRHLQQQRGVLYAAFVHDCIPLIVPETCAAGLVADFRDWFAAAMHATDLTFANSRCTAQDMVGCAQAAGLPVPAPHVVRLDAHAGVRPAGAAPGEVQLAHAKLGFRCAMDAAPESKP